MCVFKEWDACDTYTDMYTCARVSVRAVHAPGVPWVNCTRIFDPCSWRIGAEAQAGKPAGDDHNCGSVKDFPR